MKGFTDSSGKFRPITDYKKVRKSRDSTAKKQGVKIRNKRYDRDEEQPHPSCPQCGSGNIASNSTTAGCHNCGWMGKRHETGEEPERKSRVQPDLGHGTGKFAEFKSKNDFWDYLQNERHVARRFEENSPNMEPEARVIMSRVVNKSPTKVGFQSIHQPNEPISYLYKSELKDAIFEPDTMDGGTKVVIHDIDDFTNLRRVYRVWNGY